MLLGKNIFLNNIATYYINWEVEFIKKLKTRTDKSFAGISKVSLSEKVQFIAIITGHTKQAAIWMNKTSSL